jgi:cytochrome c5
MKKISVSLLILTAIVFSCSKKTVPTTTTETPAAKTDTVETVSPYKKVTDIIAAGKVTYEASCKRCHALHNPNEYTASRWVGIVSWMAPKVPLKDDEKNNVLQYLQANAKP